MLSVRNLSKSFGALQALRHATFDVRAGAMLALIGPNGSGKSTCFQCLNGQLRPDEGSIRLNGDEISGTTVAARARRGIGRTFQISQVASSLTVRQHLSLALAARHKTAWAGLMRRGFASDDEARQLLSRFDLAQVADRRCAELPYPDLKRVELACVLAQRPKVLLMDEPTAGMTRNDRHALMRIVAEEAGHGLAVLFTEHSMDVVFGFADRVLVLVRGEIIADGLPAQVQLDPAVRSAYLGKRSEGGAP